LPLILEIAHRVTDGHDDSALQFLNNLFQELAEMIFSSFCGCNFSSLLEAPPQEMLAHLRGENYFEWLFTENYDDAIEAMEERFGYIATFYLVSQGEDAGDPRDLLVLTGNQHRAGELMDELTHLASLMTLFIRDLFLFLYPHLQSFLAQAPFPIGDVMIERVNNGMYTWDLLVTITAQTPTSPSTNL
jgi:hypothetical protein